MDIIIPNEKELYKDYIDRILSSRENNKDKDNYQERHHILPKSSGGSNDITNLVYLYPEEHYHAHKLLALENPKNYALVAAWHKMQNPIVTNQQRNYIVSAEDYGVARRMFGELHSQRMKGENNPNYGLHISEEQKIAISEAWKKHTHPICKKIKNLETEKVFETCVLAAKWCGLSDSSVIIKQAKGKRKSAGKHPETGEKLHWEYVE